MSYNPSNGTTLNKSIGLLGKPADLRTYKFIEGDFEQRVFITRNEILAEFDTSLKRQGHFFVVLNTGGSVVGNTVTGGTNEFMCWTNGITDNDLVPLTPGATSAILGMIRLTGDLAGTAQSPTVPGLQQKASLSGGKVPDSQLPDNYWAGVTGDGSSESPFTPGSSGGIGNPEDIPGFIANQAQMLYTTEDGIFELGPIPSGSSTPLGTPDLVAGTPTINAIPFSWDPVDDATTYELKKGATNNPAAASVIYSGSGLSFVSTGLTTNTSYWHFLRVKASGYITSDYDSVQISTAAAGNETPPAPTSMVVNDVAKTFTFTNAVGHSTTQHEYRYVTDGAGMTFGSWAAVTTKPITLPNSYIPVNGVEVRVAARTGFDAGPVLRNATAFIWDPPAPTSFGTDDVDDLATFTESSGVATTEHEYQIAASSINSVTTNPIPSGNIAIAAGDFKIRVKAGTGRRASNWLVNTVAFTATDASAEVTVWRLTYGARQRSGDPNTVEFTPGSGDVFGFGFSDLKREMGTESYVMGTAKVRGMGHLYMDTDNLDLNNAGKPAVRWEFVDDGSFRRVVNGNFQQANISGAVANSDVKLRIRITAANQLYYEYSIDTGTSWSSVGNHAVTTDLYFKVSCFPGSGGNTVDVVDIRQLGLVPV